MTFDLDLWHTDLNINRDHLLIKDYLPTKVEASEAKHSWVISCTRWSKLAWPLTLTFDLLTWISIGVISASRTIYLPSLKLLGQSVLFFFFFFFFFFWYFLLIPKQNLFRSAGWVNPSSLPYKGNAFLNNSACTLNSIWLLHNCM